jgi:choline dehydrogenase-like flavoprotein
MYDYIIVGSGAGGSAAAYWLAETGKTVLLLEKGRALPTDGTTLDIQRVFQEGYFLSREPWLDKDGRTVIPEEHFNLGGKTKWYGAALLRFSPHEFDADPDHRCRAWPIAHEDIAPYYEQAERLLMVRRFPVEQNLKAILARFAARDPNWHEQPLPIGLAENILDHPEEAKRFDGFASVMRLKSDAEVALIDKVRDRPNLHILTGKAVESLLGVEGNPRVIRGVVCEDGSRFHAGTVLLAAGALHSPRLLQRYLDDGGLAQELPSYRLIGHYYKCHLNTALVAFSRLPNTDVLCKTALLLNRTCPHSSVQALGGGLAADLVGAQFPRSVPRWFSAPFGRRAYGFFLTTEDGSHEDNRVEAPKQANGVQ